MEELLTILEAWLKENRPEFFKELLRGRTEEQLKAFEEKLGFALPEDFKTLYACMNGSFGGEPGQIVACYSKGERRTIRYPDVRSWLRVFVSSFQHEDKSWEELRTEHIIPDVYIKMFEPGYPKHFD